VVTSVQETGQLTRKLRGGDGAKGEGQQDSGQRSDHFRMDEWSDVCTRGFSEVAIDESVDGAGEKRSDELTILYTHSSTLLCLAYSENKTRMTPQNNREDVVNGIAHPSCPPVARTQRLNAFRIAPIGAREDHVGWWRSCA
jgi:hypothetical protein